MRKDSYKFDKLRNTSINMMKSSVNWKKRERLDLVKAS